MLPQGSDIARQLDSIEQAATRASGMTAQLLAFSRRQIVAPKVVYVDRLVDRLRDTLGRLIGEDVDVRFETQEGLWPVRIDPVQLEQVILNLAVNARDAMPEGGTLTIKTCNGSLPTPRGDADRVHIKVQDTGVGVKDDVLPHIFEPFFTTKEVGRGTGLGLSTSYGIVQQAGGEITVQSVPGRGSTFTVSLPRVEPVEADATEEHVEGAPVGGSETILLVEDESLVRELATQVLSDHGYRLLATSGPGAALEAARSYEGAIDLLVTDVVLPGQSGPELVEEILHARPGLAVLYTSGFSDHPAVQRQVEEGRHAFLAKPFTPQGLRARVREVLDAHQA